MDTEKPVTFTIRVPLEVNSCRCDGCDSGRGEFTLEVEVHGVLSLNEEGNPHIALDEYGSVKGAERWGGTEHMEVKVS